MQGDGLATLKHTLLGLDEELIIWGIRCASNGLLHVVGGDQVEIQGEIYGKIQSFHAYKVG